ncbi:MAG: hypothetical protein QI197_03695 [Candidatus Korarchaeota archaeon]|nr:hypothetical protein [Candidatus Korarchaeota archaeon]
MSERSERIKNLLKLREFLKKRIEKLEREVLQLREMVEVLDQVLLEQTLVTADQLKSEPEIQQFKDVEERRLTSEDGTLIGIARVNKRAGSIVFVPTENVMVDARERPISSFLVRKVEEYGGRCEVDEYPNGRLRAIRIQVEEPQNLERIFRALRWAITKSLVQ